MIYCIANQINYSSSFNIFAVIAGIFLVRQSLKTAKLVAWFSAFLLSGFAGAAILLPFLTPLDLWGTQFRLNPLMTVLAMFASFAIVGFVFWVYRNLTSPAVLDARRSAGISAKKPISAFIVGSVLAVGLFGLMVVVTNGDSAKKAELKAREQFGSNYKYQVTSIHWSGASGSATMTAYNHDEIKEVHVEW